LFDGAIAGVGSLRASSATDDHTTDTCAYTHANPYANANANANPYTNPYANAGTYSINRNAPVWRHPHLPPGRRPDQLR
jgi:hypothetical protein